MNEFNTEYTSCRLICVLFLDNDVACRERGARVGKVAGGLECRVEHGYGTHVKRDPPL